MTETDHSDENSNKQVSIDEILAKLKNGDFEAIGNLGIRFNDF